MYDRLFAWQGQAPGFTEISVRPRISNPTRAHYNTQNPRELQVTRLTVIDFLGIDIICLGTNQTLQALQEPAWYSRGS